MQGGLKNMVRIIETTAFLRETGYPDSIFLYWGITLNDDNREQAKKDLEKILAEFPPLEQDVVKLRYQYCLTLNQISEKLQVPVYIIRKRKNDVLRKAICTRAGVMLFQSYSKNKKSAICF